MRVFNVNEIRFGFKLEFAVEGVPYAVAIAWNKTKICFVLTTGNIEYSRPPSLHGTKTLVPLLA